MRTLALIVLGLALSTAACVPMGQSGYGSAYGSGGYGSGGSGVATQTYDQAQTSGTGIFVNGHELTAAEQAELEQLIGEPVPPARYTINPQNGDIGYEGHPPVANLQDIARKRQQSGGKPVNLYSRDSAGRGSSIVSEGGCTILSTPDGSLSSGC